MVLPHMPHCKCMGDMSVDHVQNEPAADRGAKAPKGPGEKLTGSKGAEYAAQSDKVCMQQSQQMCSEGKKLSLHGQTTIAASVRFPIADSVGLKICQTDQCMPHSQL